MRVVPLVVCFALVPGRGACVNSRVIVCMDIQAGVAQRAGVGRYVQKLVEQLGACAAPSDELRLFFFDFQRQGLPLVAPGAVQRACRWVPGRYVQAAWKRLHFPPFDWLAGAADVYHFPNFIVPPLTRGKAVVTIHDVSFLRFPEAAEPRNLAYLKAKIRDTVARADAIITVSAFSGREIQELLGVPAEKIHPILHGLPPEFRRPTREAIAAARQQLGLERPYLLSVGTLEPRKNFPFLVEIVHAVKQHDFKVEWPDGEEPTARAVEVTLLLDIGLDGKVDKVRLLRGAGEPFDSQAIAALKQQQFKPGTRDGKPFRDHVSFVVEFKPSR